MSSVKKAAKELVGKRVVVHHVEGWSCYAVLHSVIHEGIYLTDTEMIEHSSSAENKPTLQHTVTHDTNLDSSQVYFPFLFLPFAALAGLAAASAVRPPYYYGGYPGYGPGVYPW
ncbi:MAG: hypothetical protein A2201_09410 [Alicyclobacillus sp. RIFOXYA1_FULL_53_8]|nr:MAG: hypothetical protein A2201_09410 [Alicyclobacillus sp. RIFOXYA1_FULL_53_8]